MLLLVEHSRYDIALTLLPTAYLSNNAPVAPTVSVVFVALLLPICNVSKTVTKTKHPRKIHNGTHNGTDKNLHEYQISSQLFKTLANLYSFTFTKVNPVYFFIYNFKLGFAPRVQQRTLPRVT